MKQIRFSDFFFYIYNVVTVPKITDTLSFDGLNKVFDYKIHPGVSVLYIFTCSQVRSHGTVRSVAVILRPRGHWTSTL